MGGGIMSKAKAIHGNKRRRFFHIRCQVSVEYRPKYTTRAAVRAEHLRVCTGDTHVECMRQYPYEICPCKKCVAAFGVREKVGGKVVTISPPTLVVVPADATEYQKAFVAWLNKYREEHKQ